MANSDSEVWLITGSSTGFGRSLTAAVLDTLRTVAAQIDRPLAQVVLA